MYAFSKCWLNSLLYNWHYVKFFNTFDRVKSYGIEKSNKLCYSDIEDIHKDWSVTFPWNQP